MPDTVHGTLRADTPATDTIEYTPADALNSINGTQNGVYANSESPETGIELRPRIDRRKVAIIRRRVRARAAELQLRCGILLVLNAALSLLLTWKTVRDERVRLHHISARFPRGTRRLTPTTIGRLLTQLHNLELLVYSPALGRGNCATIAIHPAFLDGVTELARDSDGRVITPDRPATAVAPSGGESACAPTQIIDFSTPRLPYRSFLSKTSISSSATDQPRSLPNPRPTEVPVDPAEVRQVLAAMPECYRTLPSNLRWSLGSLVRQRLARGFQPEQILAILTAPLPAGLSRPYALAKRRFALNMPGIGPRLRPLQRTWDTAATAHEQRTWQQAVSADYRALTADIGTHLAEQLTAAALAAPRVHSADNAPPAIRRQSAALGAARQALRAFPGQPITVAARHWLAEHPGSPAPARRPVAPAVPGALATLTISDLLAMAPAGRCTKCGAIDAQTRHGLPVPIPVCQDCWDSPDVDPDLRAAATATPIPV